ncbi:MAG TPA: ATP-binding cassette domain-containing protein, partial [Myxococcota bacterium]|nr:ATP-binding cassette domain-containing protein [Myxococcota bacterium]
MSETRIRVAGLGVRYGERWALRDVSFEVAAGEVVALLGPNGAGKTTLLSVLAGLFAPQEGKVELGGFDVVSARARAQRVAGLV